MGKTSLVLSAAQNAALGKTGDAQAVIAIFSLEMSKNELGMRLLSGLSKINSKTIRQVV